MDLNQNNKEKKRKNNFPVDITRREILNQEQPVVDAVPITIDPDAPEPNINPEILQQYDQARICMEKACKGFHEINETDNEVNALCQLAVIKGHLNDMMGALDIYQTAQQLVIELKDDEKLMDILKQGI